MLGLLSREIWKSGCGHYKTRINTRAPVGAKKVMLACVSFDNDPNLIGRRHVCLCTAAVETGDTLAWCLINKKTCEIFLFSTFLLLKRHYNWVFICDTFFPNFIHNIIEILIFYSQYERRSRVKNNAHHTRTILARVTACKNIQHLNLGGRFTSLVKAQD